jgi:uncharacterized membrane protein required for colicin V production
MLEGAIIITIGMCGLKGFSAGDSKEMRGLVSLALSYGLAHLPRDDIALELQESGFTANFSETLALSLTTMVLFPAMIAFLSLLAREFNYFGRRIPLSKRLIGAGIGTLKGIVLWLLAINVLLRLPLDTDLRQHSPWIRAMDCSKPETRPTQQKPKPNTNAGIQP